MQRTPNFSLRNRSSVGQSKRRQAVRGMRVNRSLIMRNVAGPPRPRLALGPSHAASATLEGDRTGNMSPLSLPIRHLSANQNRSWPLSHQAVHKQQSVDSGKITRQASLRLPVPENKQHRWTTSIPLFVKTHPPHGQQAPHHFIWQRASWLPVPYMTQPDPSIPPWLTSGSYAYTGRMHPPKLRTTSLGWSKSTTLMKRGPLI